MYDKIIGKEKLWRYKTRITGYFQEEVRRIEKEEINK